MLDTADDMDSALAKSSGWLTSLTEVMFLMTILRYRSLYSYFGNFTGLLFSMALLKGLIFSGEKQIAFVVDLSAV